MIRALIVDDELQAREEFAALLSETGAATVVGSAPDAIAGMRAIRDLRPDVVFLDVQMPAVNGFEMLSMMDDVELPDVPSAAATWRRSGGALGSDRSHPGTDRTPFDSSRSPDPHGCLGAKVVEQGKRGGAA